MRQLILTLILIAVSCLHAVEKAPEQPALSPEAQALQEGERAVLTAMVTQPQAAATEARTWQGDYAPFDAEMNMTFTEYGLTAMTFLAGLARAKGTPVVEPDGPAYSRIEGRRMVNRYMIVWDNTFLCATFMYFRNAQNKWTPAQLELDEWLYIE
ncbi:MAG: hypothetical protein PF961_05670 [Planctomycetota bacterium]|jgi:hypothetical protein|nr:hypothetical protein [Planctomycetota bacterium]